MVGPNKTKNKAEPSHVLKSGKNTFTVGSRFEAKDSVGEWYIHMYLFHLES